MDKFHALYVDFLQGDRAGICVTQFDPSQLERGLVCSSGALVTVEAIIISVKKIAYYKSPITTKSKFHITLGHETVMGRISIFSSKLDDTLNSQSEITKNVDDLEICSESSFDFSKEYVYQDEYVSMDQKEGDKAIDKADSIGRQYALIELEKPVICPPHSIIIGSRLDADVHTSSCRIAFHGNVLHAIDDTKFKETVLPSIRIFKVSYSFLQSEDG